MSKILIIENSKFATERLKSILQDGNHEVIAEATNAKDGIEQFKKMSPDLVTLDMVMPNEDNKDYLSAIEEIKKINPLAKIIVVSGVIQQPMMQEALDAGADDYLTKPLNDAETLRKVEECLKA